MEGHVLQGKPSTTGSCDTVTQAGCIRHITMAVEIGSRCRARPAAFETMNPEIAKLAELMKQLAPKQVDSAIYCHPDNVGLLRQFEMKADDSRLRMAFRMPLFADAIIPTRAVPKTQKTGRLIWPQDPFVTYEESDRSWSVPLGIAKEEEEVVFYRVPYTPGLLMGYT